MRRLAIFFSVVATGGHTTLSMSNVCLCQCIAGFCGDLVMNEDSMKMENLSFGAALNSKNGFKILLCIARGKYKLMHNIYSCNTRHCDCFVFSFLRSLVCDGWIMKTTFMKHCGNTQNQQYNEFVPFMN